MRLASVFYWLTLDSRESASPLVTTSCELNADQGVSIGDSEVQMGARRHGGVDRHVAGRQPGRGAALTPSGAGAHMPIVVDRNSRLHTAANIMVIAAAVCVVGVALQVALTRRNARNPTPTYAVGEKINAVDGLDFRAASTTLLMVLREDCRYCQASLTFYQRLTQRSRVCHLLRRK